MRSASSDSTSDSSGPTVRVRVPPPSLPTAGHRRPPRRLTHEGVAQLVEASPRSSDYHCKLRIVLIAGSTSPLPMASQMLVRLQPPTLDAIDQRGGRPNGKAGEFDD